MPRRKLDPLPSSAFHILLALADGEKHGYAIMRNVAEDTDNKVRLGPGTLYGSIQTLLDAEYVEEIGERSEPAAGDERRRYYRLTGTGRAALKAEAERMAALLRLAKSKKVLKGAHV
jgi:DNA-binding PadR family transcriptional regulator